VHAARAVAAAFSLCDVACAPTSAVIGEVDAAD
jgi:hypothetical protein